MRRNIISYAVMHTPDQDYFSFFLPDPIQEYMLLRWVESLESTELMPLAVFFLFILNCWPDYQTFDI